MAFNYSDSDDSYDDKASSLDPSTMPRRKMSLRDTSRIKRPVRYRDDLEPIDPGRPIFVHQDPIFNKDRAKFVQWHSLELDQPSPGEAQYKVWQEQGEPRDAFGEPVMPSPGRVHAAESPGPTVAHLRRQSVSVRPDLSQPIVDSVEKRDAFDEAFERNLAELEEDDEPQMDGDNDSIVMHPQLSSEYLVRTLTNSHFEYPAGFLAPFPQCHNEALYVCRGKKLTMFSALQDWSALSDKVQWAIIYDLANDHEGGITTAANLLGLTLPEVIKFVNTYVREKTIWENGSYQGETTHSAGALFRRNDEQDKVNQVVSEAETAQFMNDYEADRRVLGPEAYQIIIDDKFDVPVIGDQPIPASEVDLSVLEDQMIIDGGVDLPIFGGAPEGLCEMWNEPEMELFQEPEVEKTSSAEGAQVIIEKEVVQPDAEGGVDLPADEEMDEQPETQVRPPLVELITDSFSREDIASGRNFLTFVGLQQYADRFSQWFGRGTTFREIPGTFDENNDFVFSTEHTEKALYSGNESIWQGPVPQLGVGPKQREWLMEALPPDSAQNQSLVDHDFEEFKAFAERINGRRINLNETGERLFDYISEGSYGGLRRVKPVLTGTNVAYQGTHGDYGDNGARLFNMSSAMQLCPFMPRFNNGIAPRVLEVGHVDINEGFVPHQSVPPPFPPPFPKPHDSIAQPATGPNVTLGPIDRNSNHVARSDRASQTPARSASNSKASPTVSQSIEVPSKPADQAMAEKATHDVGDNTAQSSAQGPADTDQFAENGIEVETFPKCYTCFQTKSRCDGDRPCSSCLKRQRGCKDITKAILDKHPERAARVLVDKAKADRMAAEAEGASKSLATASTPSTTTSAAPVPHNVTSGVKQKQLAATTHVSTDEDDSDLDQFPPEKEDPADSDYGDAPKKKKPKKGNTATGKKRGAGQANLGVPATSTPIKKRRTYRKKDDTPTPRRKEPVAGATSTPTKQSDESVLAGSFPIAGPMQSASTDSPTAGSHKYSGSSQGVGKDNLVGVKAGRPVDNAVQGGRQPGGQLGVTNVQPVSGISHGATPKLAEKQNDGGRRLAPPNFKSGAGDSRYLNVPFAPRLSPTYTPTDRPYFPGVQMTPVLGSVAEFPGSAFYTSPSQRAHPAQVARGGLIPPRPRTVPADNDHPSGVVPPRVASKLNISGPKTQMAQQGLFPVNADRMSLMPQIAHHHPGFGGSPGMRRTSSASQASDSSKTASIDFSRIPFTGTRDSLAQRDPSVVGRSSRGNTDHQSVLGFRPTVPPSMVLRESPTVSQRPHSLSPYKGGTRRSGNSVPPPMTEVSSEFAMAYGPVSPYRSFQRQPPRPYPVAKVQQDTPYSVPQQMLHPAMPTGVFHDPQGADSRPILRYGDASPTHQQSNTASPLPAKRCAEAPFAPGQQPAAKRLKASESPLAPPREARSWKELAINQWATDTQETQSDTANFSVKPVFGGDGPFDVSFSQFARISEQVDPQLQQRAMAAARKINKSSASPSKKR